MSKKLLLMVVSFLITNISLATMFFPMPLEKQVEEATSGAEVQLVSSRYFKNAQGLIMTEYSFNVLESYNLANKDLENQKIKLTMPGGTFEGVTSMIDGAPVFKTGERSFLLLKKIESTIYLSNFTLGKYRIDISDGKIYYVSEVFPGDVNNGRIAKDKMVELMKSKWKLSVFSNPKVPLKSIELVAKEQSFPARFQIEERRYPAQEIEENEGVPMFFWISIVMVIFFFGFIFFKLGKSEFQHKRE